MKLFNKLALVAAMAFSANAMALQSMDDEALSSTTGQDGITLNIFTSKITIDSLLVHDNDGLDPGKTINVVENGVSTPQSLGGTGEAGAIVINDLEITKAGSSTTKPLAKVIIDSDGGTNTDGSQASLNVAVDLDATTISIGSIGVGRSNAAPVLTDTTSVRRGVAGTPHEIIKDLTLNLGEVKLNVQLGHQSQGSLIRLNGEILGGLYIENLTLVDNDGVNPTDPAKAATLNAIGGAVGQPGELQIGGLKVTDANSANLTASLGINIDQNLGLAVTLGNTIQDVYVNGIVLGQNTPGSIGDIEIQGMNLGGATLFVHGH